MDGQCLLNRCRDASCQNRRIHLNYPSIQQCWINMANRKIQTTKTNLQPTNRPTSHVDLRFKVFSISFRSDCSFSASCFLFWLLALFWLSGDSFLSNSLLATEIPLFSFWAVGPFGKEDLWNWTDRWLIYLSRLYPLVFRVFSRAIDGSALGSVGS